MNGQRGTLELLARHLVLAVEPVREAVSDLEHFRVFTYRLGWHVTMLPAPLSAERPGNHESARRSIRSSLRNPGQLSPGTRRAAPGLNHCWSRRWGALIF